MEKNLLEEFAPLIAKLNEPLMRNRELKIKLAKIQEENIKQAEILKYYQNALEKCRKSFDFEQETYDTQLITTRNLSENYEKQIKLAAEEKNEKNYNRTQIQLLSNEISILKDKLEIVKKTQALSKNLKPSSKISALKHEAFKLQEKLKNHKFS